MPFICKFWKVFYLYFAEVGDILNMFLNISNGLSICSRKVVKSYSINESWWYLNSSVYLKATGQFEEWRPELQFLCQSEQDVFIIYMHLVDFSGLYSNMKE